MTKISNFRIVMSKWQYSSFTDVYSVGFGSKSYPLLFQLLINVGFAMLIGSQLLAALTFHSRWYVKAAFTLCVMLAIFVAYKTIRATYRLKQLDNQGGLEPMLPGKFKIVNGKILLIEKRLL